MARSEKAPEVPEVVVPVVDRDADGFVRVSRGESSVSLTDLEVIAVRDALNALLVDVVR